MGCGFLAIGFTSSKHNAFVKWLLIIFDGITFSLGIFAYIILSAFIFTKSRSLFIEYFALIIAIIHLIASAILFVHDIIVKSDTMFIAGPDEPYLHKPIMTSVSSCGSFEINSDPDTDLAAQQNKLCWQVNPWALYLKHYIVTSIKIVCIVLDITILIIFNDSWKCAKMNSCL